MALSFSICSDFSNTERQTYQIHFVHWCELLPVRWLDIFGLLSWNEHDTSSLQLCCTSHPVCDTTTCTYYILFFSLSLNYVFGTYVNLNLCIFHCWSQDWGFCMKGIKVEHVSDRIFPLLLFHATMTTTGQPQWPLFKKIIWISAPYYTHKQNKVQCNKLGILPLLHAFLPQAIS